MSVAGVIAIKGARCDVYRPTYTTTPSGTRKVSVWGTPVHQSIKVLIEAITDEQVQKVFGGSGLVKERGFVNGLPDLQGDDVINVLSGRRLGSRFRIEDARPQQRGLKSHLELSLVSTTETIS